ncbi:MAG TPA: SpoIID/LytB domain-containing protein [Blastocatellia bacterium]|nr:SpoIID/LytB domain-containing protein [Blastocatellia bacterium]
MREGLIWMAPEKTVLHTALLMAAMLVVSTAFSTGCSSRQVGVNSSIGTGSLPDAATPARAPLTDLENISRVDRSLHEAAEKALGEREGTVLVMDPRTGRLIAVVNPRLAFEQAFPPGSAIKPFTTLAAMRSGVIDQHSRVLCGGAYASEGFRIVCSHPPSKAPFDLPQALAYSCNYYFAKTAERLSPSAFENVLVSYGFGRRTGINAPESPGRIPESGMRLKTALGEGDEILVTPIQLLRAYVALFSGELYRPWIGPANPGKPADSKELPISSQERAALVKGLRGAVVYGTAMNAGLKSVPMFIYGKTGTSTASNGFRTQGWFVSMTAIRADVEPDLAVLVFLKRSHGSEGAEVARGVYQEYVKLGLGGPGTYRSQNLSSSESRAPEKIAHNPGEPLSGGRPVQDSVLPCSATAERPSDRSSEFGISHAAHLAPQDTRIKVHLVSQNKTESLSLEDYILGVVLAEASVETELEALKAQAVISRTYALKNLRRHAHEGYDFCSTTHCQRYVDPGQKPELEQLARRAVAETAGQVLVDSHGRLIDAYFGGSCGGMSADIGTLWGVPAPSYLRGVPDTYCSSMPHAHWTETIPLAKLRGALRSDSRTDPGAGLADVKVARRDHTGRAQLVEIDGAKRKTVSGWVFKIVVGRALGWNVLLSSRFDVERHGNDFVFHGSGFGHGLGLCQQGSHVMASRGFGYRAILSHYFPGTKATAGPAPEISRAMLHPVESPGIAPAVFRSDQVDPAFFRPAVYDHQARLSSEHFRLNFPAALDKSDAALVLDTLESARRDMLGRLSAASVQFDSDRPVDIFLYDTTQQFMAATGLPWWSAGVTHGSRIDLQPVRVLKRRGIVTTTLRHEYAHFVIVTLSRKRAPRWIEEGLAAYFAGEGPLLNQDSGRQGSLSPDEIDRGLAQPASQPEMKHLYAAAYRRVTTMISAKGEPAVWRSLAQCAAGTPE